MSRVRLSRFASLAVLSALVAVVTVFATQGLAADAHTTKPFSGVKVNGGTATHSKQGNRHVLTLSDDFQVPDTPAPHWQVVDSRGNTYLLQRLVVKGDKFHKQIVVPSYVPDIARVEIWCAWAETLLGEASFDSPLR